MIKNKIVEYRRHFHRNPEIGYNTQNTNAYVMNILSNLGYSITPVLNQAGCVARLDLGKSSTYAFRSDLDALEIQECTNLEFKSKNGYMHACGHDAHISVLLGAAHLFIEHKNELQHNIVLIFQPAEEGPLPGGAVPLMKEYDLSFVDYFFAYHVTNKLYVGEIGIKPKEACASPDLWECSIKGRGCHGSTPELGASPILPAARIIEEFQKLHNLKKDKFTIVSTTYMKAGVSMNIIPDTSELKGTARSFTNDERDELNNEMTNIVQSVCKEFNVEGDFRFHYAYDPVYNDPEAVDKVLSAAGKILHENKIHILQCPEMVGEDFSYYRKCGKSCLTWLGVRGKEQDFYDLHSSKFLLDEDALYPASQILLEIAKG